MSDESKLDMSKMRLWSLGRAANNKILKDADGRPNRELEVTPIEHLGDMDGELVSLPFESEASGQSADGSEYTAKVTLNTAMTATWLPLGSSNRLSPPDVRRGERVFLYRYADTDQVYWTTTGWDDHLRRLETVHYQWSATKDESADMTDTTNYYHLQISTHEGMIHLETTDKNGEKATFVLQINTKDGLIVLQDSFGNFLNWDSVENDISIQNGDGTIMRLNKEVFYAYAKDKIIMIAEQQILFQTKQYVLSTQTALIEASESYTVRTPNYNVESTTNTFTSPNTSFSGNVSIGGSLVGAANGGTMTFKGACEFEMNATFKAPVSLAGGTTSATLTGPNGRI